MRVVSALLLFGVVALGCSRAWDDFEVGATGSGGASGAGGTGAFGGGCTAGSKVCPDPASGDLVCLDTTAPETGCRGTSCEPCQTANASAKCDVQGACAVDQCNAGHADCNGDSSDGCESDLQNDPTHCGDCATDCIASQGTGFVCKSGVCTANECVPPTTADCDNDKTNGCEVDISSDAQNCGYCGNACALSHASNSCVQGKCAVTGCAPAYQDCDGQPANGCEVNVSSDAANCGACGVTCDATNGAAGCAQGNCAIVCSQNYANCDQSAANGCEVSLATDPANCGTCGKACTPANAAAPSCAQGACGYTSCLQGYADCDGNKANGCEVNVNTDSNHCGDCATVCSSVCSGGKCGTSCAPPFVLCGASCVDTQTSTANCGDCGKPCPLPPAHATSKCAAGICGFDCVTGYSRCGDSCYNLQTDANHCSTCATVCPAPVNATGVCAAGSCTMMCNPGYTNCGGKCVDLATDSVNCGTCGHVCSGGACSAGKC
jgi:hypothetical protein